MADRTLTEQQQKFIDEYLADLNGTQAAIRAGYSVKTARVQASRLLTNVNISTAIGVARAERSKRTGINADRILEALGAIALGDPRSVLQWGADGVHLVPSLLLSAEDAAMIAEVEEKTGEFGTTIKVKFHDRLKAIELAMRHLGLQAPIKIDLGEQLRKAAVAEGLDPDEVHRVATQIAASLV